MLDPKVKLDRVNAIAEELLQQLDAFQSNQHHSFVTTQQMAREAATVIRLLQAALQPSGQTLPKPGRNDGGEPCGECHLQPGETCDICGAAQPSGQTRAEIIEECAKVAEAWDGKPCGPASGWTDDQRDYYDAGQLDASSSIVRAIRALAAQEKEKTQT